MTDQLVCPSCHTPLPEAAAFCYVCGTPTPTALQADSGAATTRPSLQSAAAVVDVRKRLEKALGPNFTVGDLVGRGGFAEVFAVRDNRLKRDLAVKVLSPELVVNQPMLHRFRREAEAALATVGALWRFWWVRGIWREGRNRFEAALALVQRAVTLRPDAAVCRNNLGQVLERLGREEEAAHCYEAAIALDPRYAEAHNNLGYLRARQDRLTDAEALYLKAIALDPNYALAYLNLGILYDLYLGDSKRALELYDRYLALSPTADERVQKWVSDIKNRAPRSSVAARKEQG